MVRSFVTSDWYREFLKIYIFLKLCPSGKTRQNSVGPQHSCLLRSEGLLAVMAGYRVHEIRLRAEGLQVSVEGRAFAERIVFVEVKVLLLFLVDLMQLIGHGEATSFRCWVFYPLWLCRYLLAQGFLCTWSWLWSCSAENAWLIPYFNHMLIKSYVTILFIIISEFIFQIFNDIYMWYIYCI